MEKYFLITHDNNNPYFNIASEEYLLKEKDGFYYYFWINEPSVIIGTNQNTLAEVNLSYVEDKGIKVVRRLTGGGAVYRIRPHRFGGRFTIPSKRSVRIRQRLCNRACLHIRRTLCTHNNRL